ncbi:TrkH family potassium uptake protein [Yunchengibacter salinarum]|uniref:TrkH family potassium uptake protein n=1 Tax=Yunchengibacter salinarum TaxID=3133399 RepID=UPI0035B64C56
MTLSIPDLRPVLHVVGILITLMGATMALPVLADLIAGHPDWRVFLAAMALTGTLGGMMVLATRGYQTVLSLRQAFLLTILAWFILPAFGALPLVFSARALDFASAYFEAASGLTTTGASVLSGLDDSPPGLLLWRQLLHWLGGLGIVVMMVAIMPMLQEGGMQIFRMESSDTSEKILPRARQIVGAITSIYVSLTALCALILIFLGLGAFDAVSHAMSTVSTGGFANYDASISHFDSAAVDMTILTFMILGGLPFLLILQLIRGRPAVFWRDEQVRVFFGVIVFLSALMTLWLYYNNNYTLFESFRYGTFNIISVLTTTGLTNTNYFSWGSFATIVFLFVSLIGACAGSTSGAIKIFRFIVVFKEMAKIANKIVAPNGLFIAKYNKRKIDNSVENSIFIFILLFFAILVAITFILSMTGLGFKESLFSAVITITNVGVGPTGDIGAFSDLAKWTLSLAMVLGRLELFTVLVLISPAFWRG